MFDYCRLEATKSAILPELVELTNDEECHVRIAGLETVVNILSLLDAGGYTAGPLWVLCRYSLDILKVHCRYTIGTLWVY